MLYLVRHAHAVEAGEDPERPLNKRGCKQVRALADFLRANGALQRDGARWRVCWLVAPKLLA